MTRTIIANCGCFTSETFICQGCGCCNQCCDGYPCDDCGVKCLDRMDWGIYGGAIILSLCENCIEERWRAEKNEQ